MWIAEIKEHFGFDPGVIGGGKYIRQEAPIVVGNIQTVHKFISKHSRDFGMIIIDECHHCSADTFSKVLNISTASIKLGLSGTTKRKDGKHILFNDFFTSRRFIGKDENRMTPNIWTFESDVELSSNSMIPWGVKMNDLVASNVYYLECLFLIESMRKLGHKVLFLSDRTAFLERLFESFDDSKVQLITGTINSSTEERDNIKDLIYAGECNLLFGTQSIFSEGVSFNPLSCVILGTPISNESLLEQIIGRIMRQFEGKPTPIAIDILLKGNTAKRQSYTRKAVYTRESWPVTSISKTQLIKKVLDNEK